MTAAPATAPDTLVIGAGIVGICVAASLAETGHAVAVIDRTGICEETSSGNAGAFAFSDVLPLAQKGMLAHAPKWLLDPLGPLSVRPSYLPHLLPWLMRFRRAAAPGRYEAGLAAQAALMKLAEAEWTGLMRRSGTTGMLREDGSLELYEGKAEFLASLPGWEARERHGIVFRHLKKDELGEYQPGLSGRFTHGTFVPGWKTVSDPRLVGKAIWAYAEKKGATFTRSEVREIRPAGSRWRFSTADGKEAEAGRVVLCAGAWSGRLAKQMGDAIPLDTERGYNTTLPPDAFDLKRQLIFSGHGFVVTPLSTGIRVGGAVEFGGLRLPPNFARSKAMLEKAKRFLPGLRTEGGREWMGYRPSLPDSLPVIGPAPRHAGLFYAFGHGHLGLTQAAATGRLIRDLVSGEALPIDLSPFRANRF
jgi:D-amino-acid dehydrogenase